MDKKTVLERLSQFRVEVPSWGFARSGTRFHAFHIPGEARNLEEKIEDASIVHQLTGGVGAVALHIPWDKTDDFSALKRMVEDRGLRVGAVNPNLFQEEVYLYGALSNAKEEIRRQAVDHCLECVDIMRQTGSEALSMWLIEGSNYPGQVDFAEAFELTRDGLKKVYEAMDEDMSLLIEYKFFEPTFYHTVLADWGSALLMANDLGEKAKVLIDLGHHPQSTNIEYIVTLVSMRKKLGGFHFNSRKYADDDLTVGSLNPYELFLIFAELNKFYNLSSEVPEVFLVIDQSHNVKCKIKAMVQSVLSLQESYAKSLLIDYDKLRKLQHEQDVVGCEEVLKQAYATDVRPLLLEMRQRRNLPENPLEYFTKSGLEAERIKKRG